MVHPGKAFLRRWVAVAGKVVSRMRGARMVSPGAELGGKLEAINLPEAMQEAGLPRKFAIGDPPAGRAAPPDGAAVLQKLTPGWLEAEGVVLEVREELPEGEALPDHRWVERGDRAGKPWCAGNKRLPDTRRK